MYLFLKYFFLLIIYLLTLLYNLQLKSNQYCYKFKHHVIESYGFTEDPESKDYMLVMQYASGGDLHNYLQREFTGITWNKEKLNILWQISEGYVLIIKIYLSYLQTVN